MLRDAGRAEWAAAWAFPRPPQGTVTSLCLAAVRSAPHSSTSQGRAPCRPPRRPRAVPPAVACPLPPPAATPCSAARRGVPPAVPRGDPVARPAPGSPMHTFSSSSSAEPLR